MSEQSEPQIEHITELIWEIIPKVHRELRAILKEAAVDLQGLTWMQYHMLRHVQAGTKTVAELASRHQISRSAISQAVDTLEQQGLLKRVTRADDRRFQDLELTPQAEAALSQITESSRKTTHDSLRSLTRDELHLLEQALALLGRLNNSGVEGAQ